MNYMLSLCIIQFRHLSYKTTLKYANNSSYSIKYLTSTCIYLNSIIKHTLCSSWIVVFTYRNWPSGLLLHARYLKTI